MTNEDHNKYVSYGFLGYAAFNLVWLGLMCLFFLFSMIIDPVGPPTGVVFLVGFAMILMLALFTLPAAIAGLGGIKQEKLVQNCGNRGVD